MCLPPASRQWLSSSLSSRIWTLQESYPSPLSAACLPLAQQEARIVNFDAAPAVRILPTTKFRSDGVDPLPQLREAVLLCEHVRDLSDNFVLLNKFRPRVLEDLRRSRRADFKHSFRVGGSLLQRTSKPNSSVIFSEHAAATTRRLLKSSWALFSTFCPTAMSSWAMPSNNLKVVSCTVCSCAQKSMSVAAISTEEALERMPEPRESFHLPNAVLEIIVTHEKTEVALLHKSKSQCG